MSNGEARPIWGGRSKEKFYGWGVIGAARSWSQYLCLFGQ